MLKKISFVVFIISVCSTLLFAQQAEIYNPNADAKAEIAAAVKKANSENKHVFLQIGGNWCSWCIKFHRFVDSNDDIKTYVKENFEVVKVNYDPKNKNEEVLASLDFPQRFGFPVFVILDKNGKRIHTQNSAFLEKDSGYDKDRVIQFFKHWSPAAINPNSYK